MGRRLPRHRPAGKVSNSHAQIRTGLRRKQKAWCITGAQENVAGSVVIEAPASPRALPLTQCVHRACDASVLADAQERRNHLLHQLLQLQITLTWACGLMNTLEMNIQERQRSV